MCRGSDNRVRSHHNDISQSTTRELFVNRGHGCRRGRRLPAGVPAHLLADLSPIEEAASLIKALVKAAAPRTAAALDAAIAAALHAVAAG